VTARVTALPRIDLEYGPRAARSLDGWPMRVGFRAKMFGNVFGCQPDIVHVHQRFSAC